MSPESQSQAVERQMNLVEGANFTVEVVYFEDQAETESAPVAQNIEAQTISTSTETAALLPPIDLMDFAEPNLSTIAPEPLYVWAGDAAPIDASDELGPVSSSQHNTLQSDAQSWELAA